MLRDGGPDENLRNGKAIDVAIDHFLKFNFDVVFIATNAPGRNAFNPVERRVAPLSKVLSGVILNHDHFGSHLDKNGKTTDQELESKNFEFAGKMLCELFSNTKIDSHAVIAEFGK